MRIQHIFLSILCLSSLTAQAEDLAAPRTNPNGDIFEKIPIPGAACGDGTQYNVYIRRGSASKVLMHFEGGGACWNKGTCFGKVRFTALEDSPGINGTTYLGNHIGENPFQEYTYVYMPYCTGDMHGGKHIATYGKNKQVHHVGRHNVTRALAYIEENDKQLISRADNLVIYGESAGALGVMFNLDQVAAISKPNANKTALIDSPGLHFNDNIWGRFSPEYLQDIDDGLAANGMARNGQSGVLAPELKNLCAMNPDWKIGVAQSSMDFVMSAVFGKISPMRHYLRVMSKRGLHRTLKDPTDNCSSWIPDTSKHMFSVSKGGWTKKTWNGTRNSKYTEDLIAGRLLDTHQSHH